MSKLILKRRLFTLLDMAGNVVSGTAQGAVHGTGTAIKTMAPVGGLAAMGTGASLGASLGTMALPGIGTAIGGILGAIGGYKGGKEGTKMIGENMQDAAAAS